MTRPLRYASLLLLPLALSLGASDAAAQAGKKTSKPDARTQAFGKKKPGGKSDPKLEEAKRLFDEGAKQYGEGNYEKAIEAWEMSFDLSKKALIYESIANAYERLGQPKRAHEYLSKWRAAAPEEEHEVLNARLKNLEERVAREDQVEKDRAEQKKREQDAKDAERRKAENPGLPVLGVALAGAGVAMVAGGIVLDVVAVGKRPNEAEACRPVGERQVCRAADEDAIQTSNTMAYIGDVLWITGGVAAAAGVVLIVTQMGASAPKADATALRVTPVVGPQGGGLVIGARF
jgi:tetratricopeptide (TPR) repeat protein